MDDKCTTDIMNSVLVEDGVFIATRTGSRPALDVINRQVTYIIIIDVWIGINRPYSDSFMEIEEYIEALCTEWESLGHIMPTFEVPEILDEKDPITVHYVISVEVISPHCPVGVEGS